MRDPPRSSRGTRQSRPTHFVGVVGGPRRLPVGPFPTAPSGSTVRLVEWGANDAQHVEAQVAGCPHRVLRVTLTGWLDNTSELIRELTDRGHRLTGATDAEIVAHAYEQWGEGCVERLWGAFAFAIWDQSTRVLLLARDRSGSRPVYYCECARGFAFGTGLAALIALVDAPRDVDPQAIDAYLSLGAVPAPLSIYQGVKTLPAAHVLTLQNGTVRLRRYWSINFDHGKRLRVAEAGERFRFLFQHVVAGSAGRRPGVMLSGGLDSCIILAVLSEVSPRPVPTFTFEFPEGSSDTKNVPRIASYYGAESHVFHIRPRVLEVLPAIVRWFEQPYANPSALPMHYMASALRGHTETVLNGEGADEVFAGRERHLAAAMVNRLQRLRAGRLAAAIGDRSAGRLSLLFKGAALAAADRHILWTAVVPPEAKAELYTHELLRKIDPYFMRTMIDRLMQGATDALEQALATDFGLWIPEVLWMNLAPGTGGADIELRAPFLDHRIVEFSACLPSQLRVGWITPKVLLQTAFVGRIPLRPSRFQRGRPKIPLAPVLRGELRGVLEETLLSTHALTRGYFRPAAIRRLVSEHLTGRADHSRQLWAFLMLEQWHRQWLDR